MDLQAARDEGDFANILKKYNKPTLLSLDEWLLIRLNKAEARKLFELIHKRRNKASNLFCSQFREDEMYDHHVLQADETPVRVAKETRTKGDKHYMWVYRTGRLNK